jgi:ATP-dependent DNA ligase
MGPWRNSVRKRSPLAPATFIDPCLPSRAERAPVAEGWVHEIKHDGLRLQMHARGQRVRLYTMTGVDWTERYPWMVQDMARLNVRHAVIDAECCCDGDDGVTDFERLMARVCDTSAYAYAFDLLALDGDDMRRQPLSDRKAALASCCARQSPASATASTSPAMAWKYSSTPASSAWKASCRSASMRRTAAARSRPG